MNSDYASVTQQTGLKAGDGGFLIDVGGNTALIGSVISSSQQAVADGLNHLSTGTLTVEDIKNRATCSASQVSVGGGFSFGGGGGETAGQGGVGQDKQGNVAAGGNAKPASSVPSDKSGLAMGLPVALSASGNASSTTRSGISEGVIEIRDEAGQQALTGKSAAETIASLNRDTTDTLGALKPLFDKEKIEAGFEIGTAFAGEMGQFLTNRAREVDALEARAKDMSLTKDERDQAKADAFVLKEKWGSDGTYRRILGAVAAGAGGNVTGGATHFVQAASVNYLQGLAASQIKEIADTLGDGAEADAARAAMHAVLGCAGAAASGAACSAGALGAGASSVLAALIVRGEADDLGAEERETWSNLVAGLVGGLSSALSLDASTSVTAAVTELSNNALTLSELKLFGAEASACTALGTCDEVQDRFQKLSVKNQETLVAVCSLNAELCREQYGHYVEQITEYRQELDRLAGMDLPGDFKTDLAIYLYQNSEAVSATLHSEIAAQLVKRFGITEDRAVQLAAGAAAVAGGLKGIKVSPNVRLPGGQTGAEFEASLVGLSPGERVAKVKVAAADLADQAGWKKDGKLTRMNGRDVYRDDSGNLYALDSQRGRFEFVDAKTGKHKGEYDFSFKQVKIVDGSGKHNLKVD